MPFTGFDLSSYYASASNVVRDFFTGSAYDPLVYQVTMTHSDIITESGTGLTTAVEIQFDIKNISASKVRWPKFRLNLNWNNSSGVDNLWRYWIARHKFEVYEYVRVGSGYFSGSLNWHYGIGGSGQLSCPVICWDNIDTGSESIGSRDALGFSTDYPYICHIVPYLTGSTHYVEFRPMGTSSNQVRVLPDFISPGETKSIRFWLRRNKDIVNTPAQLAPGTDTESPIDGPEDEINSLAATLFQSTVLSCLQPYVDFMQESYPYLPPPMPRRRVLGVNISQLQAESEDPPGVGQGRCFWAFGGKRAYDFSGWDEFLDAIAERYGGVNYIKDNHYSAIMLWAVSGCNPGGGNYFPSVFTNMTSNLRDTVDQIPLWALRNGLKIYFWYGHAINNIQRGDWDSDLELSADDGVYVQATGLETTHVLKIAVEDTGLTGSGGTIIPYDQVNTWHVSDAARQDFENNIFTALEYLDGIGLDFFPEPCLDPWALDIAREIQRRYPDKWFGAEAQKSEKILHCCRNYYFGSTGFTGVGNGGYEGRCPLLYRIYPTYRDVVQTFHSAGSGGVASIISDAAFIESNGSVPMIMETVITTDWTGTDYDVEPPTKCSASRYTATSARIRWTPSVTESVVSYFIKYSTVPGGPYRNTTVHTGSFGIISGLTTGQTYYFIVSALSEYGVESDYSPEIEFTLRASAGSFGGSVSGNLYERLANLYSGVLDGLSERDADLYEAVVSIVGIETGDGAVKMELLKDFKTAYTEHSEQSDTTLLNSVRNLNHHVLRRGNYATLNDYFEAEGVLVSPAWAALCFTIGFEIDEQYVG